LVVRFELDRYVYELLHEERNLVFCYIDGQASRFSPTGRLSGTWAGTAYSNCVLFKSAYPLQTR